MSPLNPILVLFDYSDTVCVDMGTRERENLFRNILGALEALIQKPHVKRGLVTGEDRDELNRFPLYVKKFLKKSLGEKITDIFPYISDKQNSNPKLNSRGEPDPDKVLRILKQLEEKEGFIPTSIIVFDDSEDGMKMAKAAAQKTSIRIFSVGVIWETQGFISFRIKEIRLTNAGADEIVSEPQRIVEVVERLEKQNPAPPAPPAPKPT